MIAIFVLVFALPISLIFNWKSRNRCRELSTQNNQLKNLLDESNFRLKLALDAAGIAVHEWDVQTNQLIWDERLYDFWGLPPNTPLTEELFLQGIHFDDRERVKTDVAKLIEPSSNARSIQYRVIGIQTGIERWLELHGQMLFDENGLPIRFLGTAMDITSRKKIEESLRQSEQRYQQLASIDALTGVTNRRRWFELATLEIERARRYGKTLSLIILDIDHFKQVNDSYGHPAGDKVLRNFAQSCQNNLRDNDLLGRYGGEEFILLLPETTLPDACAFAERLRQTVSEQSISISAKKSLSITISIGVTILNGHILNLETLIELADKALYCAKQNGRNQVVANSSDDQTKNLQ